MRDKEEFYGILTSIDGADFSEYERLVGDFDFSRFILKIHSVQPAPDAKPSVFLVRVPQYVAGFEPQQFNTPVRRTALEDLLTRKVAAELESLARYDERGIARRRLYIARPGQKILPRTSMIVAEEYLEARIYVDLPVQDGQVAGEAAKEIFFEDLPGIVNGALIACNLDETEVENFVNLMEDADQIRQLLPTRGWVSFVGVDATLAGRDENDLPDPTLRHTLHIPEELREDIEVPNRGPLAGLGIPAGITLILGDEYSGRTALMRGLAAGVYNHVPGDGREFIVTVPDAVYVAAEADRCVQRVNVSAFLQSTANGSNPRAYTAARADPCAAQAAAAIEAVEVGAQVLICDESDSAPAFLTRDSRLAAVFAEPSPAVTPLAARAKQLVDELGVSIVVGGSATVAEFIPVADTIFKIQGGEITRITTEAQKLAVESAEPPEGIVDLSALLEHSRWIVPSSIDASAGRFDEYIESRDVHALRFGRSEIDLSAVMQLADVYQTASIGIILNYARARYMDEGRPIREILDLIDRDLSTEGLECLTRELRGDLTRPRRYEIAAALNRLDTLRVGRPVE